MRRFQPVAVGRSVLDFEPYIHVVPNGRLHLRCEQAGPGYMHPLSKDDIRQRLGQLPKELLRNLHTVYLPRMTRKRKSLDCYGLQCGGVIYLYPVREDLKEILAKPLTPAHKIELDRAGAIVTDGGKETVIQWTKDSIRNLYANNILIHELGHTLDEKNTTEKDRERYAEEFVIKWGRRKQC